MNSTNESTSNAVRPHEIVLRKLSINRNWHKKGEREVRNKSSAGNVEMSHTNRFDMRNGSEVVEYFLTSPPGLIFFDMLTHFLPMRELIRETWAHSNWNFSLAPSNFLIYASRSLLLWRFWFASNDASCSDWLFWDYNQSNASRFLKDWWNGTAAR